MFVLPEFVNELIKKIAVSEGFSDYETNVDSGSKDNDGFIGIIKSVTIQGVRLHDGKEKSETLRLMCKLIPDNEQRRQEFNTNLLFKREALLYNKVLPLITQFQRDKGLTNSDCFVSYPKCYAAIADEENDQFTIIMEDLRPKDFVMWPRQYPITPHHANLILTELAKLHAVSFALKEQQPDVYNELKQIKDIFGKMFECNGLGNWFKLAMEVAVSILDDEEHLKIAKDLQQNAKKYFLVVVKYGEYEPFGVLGHGDCWVNNHLYRYEDNKSEPAEVCILDWQMSRFHSPVLDIFDVLLITSDQEFRQKHYDNLIKNYYQALRDSVTKLGSDANKLITFNDLLLLLKKFGKYGIILNLGTVIMAIPDDGVFPDMESLSKDISDIEETIFKPFIESTRDVLHKRINDVFADLLAWGYLTD